MTKKLPTPSDAGQSAAASYDASAPTVASEHAAVPRAGRPFVALCAGIVLAAIALGAVFGVLWGVLRPGQSVQFIAPDQFGVVADSVEAPFIALAWFSCLTAVLGAVIAFIAYLRGRAYRSVVMQLWVAFSALIGSMVVFLLGQIVAGSRQPDFGSLEDGAMLTVIPAFDSYIALAVAPLIAMIVYWFGLFITDENISIGTGLARTTTGADSKAVAPGSASEAVAPNNAPEQSK